ncbi:hypothetical protein B0A55_12953 [Friedmanniomyces simplex]|uniref:Tetratricopeptide SHNi-TPR domain-containing protein n=1 Tax=Friedmanniomyces simplex TaxID=329884 RepID=A0A4U0WH42_9PEZI|nr:hypothetical protein B0A55_12953 [Friedmanniomyces simplex]
MADTPTDLLHTPTPADLTSKLDHLKASATQQYSLKNYTVAAESFSEAAELQDQLNGEMSLENADLLYQYGRCLYHVAISNSDILGGKVASAEEPKRKKRKVGKSESSGAHGGAESAGLISDALKDGDQKLAEEVVEAAVEEKDGMLADAPVSTGAKPFFQITGDENWTDSEEDEDEEQSDADAEEEEDDFAIAYEILDTARLLLSRKLEAAEQSAGKGSTLSPETRQLKERLADTHDLQAEISLENERFQDAIKDTQDALAFKLELYPEESSLIAEAHFKLSLALEFASVTSTADAGGAEAGDSVAQVDESMRKEAATEMEKAIASCRLRISKEGASLSSSSSLDDAATKTLEEGKKAVSEVKEMVADMEQRLLDLRNPAVSMSGITGPAGAPQAGMADPLRGVLGAMLGESKGEQERRVAEATEKANDLTGLVKHRKKGKVEVGGANGAAGGISGKGKRRAEDAEDEDGGAVTKGKKVKFEDGGAA